MSVSGELTGLVGESPVIQELLATIKRLTARSQASARIPAVLIEGETGTGKGLVASLLHREGPRARGPFVDVNCAAIPDTLLEAELFGFERGAFTDARQAKAGLFQTAHRGTIFLDEIGLMTPPLQAKLLKVLEERAVRRLGSTRSEPLDVWVISATNAHLDAAIREGRFREDLYHRLAVVTLSLPPLRERGSDVLLLAEHFLGRTCAEYGLPRLALAEDARARLATYAWPGNVRELANVIERASLMAEGTVLTGAMLQLADEPAPRGTRAVSVPSDPSGVRSMASVEERLILETLTETGWNISKTATQLGIARNTLRARIRKYGLQPEGALPPPPVTPVREAPASVPQPAPAAPARVGVLWESRRLAVLRVAVVAAADGPSLVESGRALDMLIEKVAAFGGRVIEISPGSITAVFGFDPVEDAPRRAALAVLAMQKAMARNASEAPLPRGAIHVVQAQTVRVGTTRDIDGDTKRQVWSALDVLLTTAEPGAIVVSELARPLLERRFTIAGAKLIDYRPTPFELGGQMGRFVGRAHELGFLRDRFETARQGQGQVVALVGEAGIGKSRLLFEFRQSLDDHRVTCLQGHCFSYASSVPYLPILEVLRALAQLSESDTPEQTAEKVRRLFEGLGMDPTHSAPYGLHLLGVKEGAEAVVALSPDVIRARTLETLHAVLTRTSERQPLVLAIEDLHWIDPASEDYLGALVERLARTRILLVVTYRPGYQPRWGQKAIASQMGLQPLAVEESLAIIRVAFGTEQVADSLTRLILAKAEGNPFFLEELARSAREHAQESTTTLAAPDTVQEVLLARIDRLPAEDRRVLQSAAVVGKYFTLDVLRAMAEVPDEALRAALQRLRAAEFVDETNLFPQPEYTFKHALTHDVAYGSLPPATRRAFHARTLRTIETLNPDRLGEHVERLAHHAFKADLWEPAFTYAREAGRKAARRSANREAVEYFEQALAALSHLPSTREFLAPAIDVRLELRHALTPLGRVQQTLKHLRAAERLAREVDDRRRLGRIVSFMTNCLVLEGRYREALDTGQQALGFAREHNDRALQLATTNFIGRARLSLGDCEGAVALFRDVIRSLDQAPIEDFVGIYVLPSVFARSSVAVALADLGDFAEAETFAREAARRADASGQPDSMVWAQWGAGLVALLQGRSDDATRVFGHLRELCRTHDVDVYVSRAAAGLGSAQARAGHVDEGVAALEEAVALDSSAEARTSHTFARAALAEAYLLARSFDRAVSTAEEARQLARTYDERRMEAYAAWVLGIAQLASNDGVRAEAALRDALAIATDLRLRPLIAHCHLGLGELHARHGAPADANEHRMRGMALIERLAMQPWIRLSDLA